MTFADLARRASLFVDANIFVFHFQPHGLFGSSCTDLLKRVELQEFSGYTSTQVLGEVAHRLMTLESTCRRVQENVTVAPTAIRRKSALATVRLEPAPPCEDQILSPARLP